MFLLHESKQLLQQQGTSWEMDHKSDRRSSCANVFGMQLRKFAYHFGKCVRYQITVSGHVIHTVYSYSEMLAFKSQLCSSGPGETKSLCAHSAITAHEVRGAMVIPPGLISYVDINLNVPDAQFCLIYFPLDRERSTL